LNEAWGEPLVRSRRPRQPVGAIEERVPGDPRGPGARPTLFSTHWVGCTRECFSSS